MLEKCIHITTMISYYDDEDRKPLTNTENNRYGKIIKITDTTSLATCLYLLVITPDLENI